MSNNNQQDQNDQDTSLVDVLPATAAIAGLAAVVTATLLLVGANDVPSLTRGAPKPTFAGASLLVLGAILAGVGLIWSSARKLILTGAYAAVVAGLVLYLVAAVHVTSDPTAPIITVTEDKATEAHAVDVQATGLAFNERIQVAAAFADDPANRFERFVIGGGGDGKAEHKFVVGPQSRTRRLQITAHVLRATGVPRDIECNDADADRTCTEAAITIPKGIPDVHATLKGQVLVVDVTDQARIPGLVAVRVTRRHTEIYATRTRVDKTPFHVGLRVGSPRGKRDVICVAAAYGEGLPHCSGAEGAGTIVRIYPQRRSPAADTVS